MLGLWLLRAICAPEKAKTRLHQRAGFMVRFSSIYLDRSIRPKVAVRPCARKLVLTVKIKSAPENYT